MFSNVFIFFRARKMGTSVYTLRILQFCDVVITPLARAWPASLALHPRSDERASEIDIARILSGIEESICSPFDI